MTLIFLLFMLNLILLKYFILFINKLSHLIILLLLKIKIINNFLSNKNKKSHIIN